MSTPPLDQLEGFCLGFDVALYRDHPATGDDGFEAYIERAIDYGLSWCERSDLVVLKDFLAKTLSEPNAAEKLSTLWENTRPHTAFFSGPDASRDQPAIVQVFARALAAIEKKLG
ncbi:hypothetical protein [Methylocystis echinoides]|uniref:hypothetical protein n=1 Tax=Methylocystis echinoides TaxID=29468 RepID=UPI003419D02A